MSRSLDKRQVRYLQGEGDDAFYDGFKPESCPYPMFSPEAKEWLTGWNDAARDVEEAGL